MTEKSTWLDRGHEAIKLLRIQSEALNYLATSFLIVGNEKMFDKLINAADDIREQAETLNSVLHDAADEMYQATWSTSGAMVSAALALCEKEKK